MTETNGRQKFIIDQAIGQIDRFEERSSENGAIDTGEALALIDRVRGVLGEIRNPAPAQAERPRTVGEMIEEPARLVAEQMQIKKRKDFLDVEFQQIECEKSETLRNLAPGVFVDAPAHHVYGGIITKIKGRTAYVEVFEAVDGTITRRFCLDDLQKISPKICDD